MVYAFFLFASLKKKDLGSIIYWRHSRKYLCFRLQYIFKESELIMTFLVLSFQLIANTCILCVSILLNLLVNLYLCFCIWELFFPTV